MATDDKKPQKVRNANNDAANWECRVRNELESVHKWNADWGEMYSNGIPFDYEGRIQYLESEVAKCPKEAKRIAKYGVGEKFKEIGSRDYRRRKMFQDPTYDDEVDENTAAGNTEK